MLRADLPAADPARDLPDVCRARAIGYGVRLSEQEYTVRAARPAEAPSILDLWRGARSTHATTSDRIEDVNRLLAELPGSLLVANAAGGVLVGALIAAWDGWRGNMYGSLCSASIGVAASA